MDTDVKIRELFAQRGLTKYAISKLGLREASKWYPLASEIQRRIYALDHHYESTAHLDSFSETELWTHLKQASNLVEGDALEALQTTVVTLLSYADDERRIHEGVRFHPWEWDTILNKKCADVRLARELIFHKLNPSPPSAVRDFFRHYDQVMELQEDFTDLQEDTHDWNLNFWLTPIRQGVLPLDAATNTRRLLSSVCQRAEEAWDRLSCNDQNELLPYWNQVFESKYYLKQGTSSLISFLSSFEWITYENMVDDRMSSRVRLRHLSSVPG